MPVKMERNGKKIRGDNFSKIKAIFKCQNEDCGRLWASFHGWKNMSEDFDSNCDSCNSTGKVTNVVENMTVADLYICSQENCGFSWNTVRAPNLLKYCPECTNPVLKSGQQQRWAKTVTFVCDSCEKSWPSLYFGKEYSQNCNECKNKGTFIDTKNVSPNDSLIGNPHDSENCDMCQELQKLGKKKNCLGNRQIEIQEVELADGSVGSIVNFQRRRPKRLQMNDFF